MSTFPATRSSRDAHIYPLFVRPRFSLSPHRCHLSAGPLGAIDFIRRFPHCSPRHAHYPPQARRPSLFGWQHLHRSAQYLCWRDAVRWISSPKLHLVLLSPTLDEEDQVTTPRASCICTSARACAWRLEEERRTPTTEKPRQLLVANHGRTIFIDLSYIDHASPDGPLRVDAPYNSGHRRSPRLQERVWSGLLAS